MDKKGTKACFFLDKTGFPACSTVAAWQQLYLFYLLVTAWQQVYLFYLLMNLGVKLFLGD
jgi:hypothetical protein